MFLKKVHPPPFLVLVPMVRASVQVKVPVIRETPNTDPTPRKPFKCHRQIKTHGFFFN